jgi:hypothetical protein
MLGILIRPEWWDWTAFLIIPLALIVAVWAVWLILSGIAGLIRSAVHSSSSRGRHQHG